MILDVRIILMLIAFIYPKRFLIYRTPFILSAHPLAALSKVWLFGCLLAGISGSNPANVVKACLL
jgi:hypothetical protein